VSDFRPFSDPVQPKEPARPLAILIGQKDSVSPFKRNDEHAGSGLDKPEPKSLVSCIADKLKSNPRPKSVKPPVS
jgi:hypothetical protein